MNDNETKIETLRQEYVRLWREGHTVDTLKRRTRKDFARLGIKHDAPDGFAEWTIYEFVKYWYRPSSLRYTH